MPTPCIELSLSQRASQPLGSPPGEVGGDHFDLSGPRGVSVWCCKLYFCRFLPLFGPCQLLRRRRYVRSATRLMAAPAEARAQRLLAYARRLWRSLRPCPAPPSPARARGLPSAGPGAASPGAIARGAWPCPKGGVASPATPLPPLRSSGPRLLPITSLTSPAVPPASLAARRGLTILTPRLQPIAARARRPRPGPPHA